MITVPVHLPLMCVDARSHQHAQGEESRCQACYTSLRYGPHKLALYTELLLADPEMNYRDRQKAIRKLERSGNQWH